MPKNFCGFCKVFCSKKICRNKKNFSKNIFSSKKIIKKFQFFYRFSSFSPVKVSKFLSSSPIFHHIFSPLTPKYHTSSFRKSITHTRHIYLFYYHSRPVFSFISVFTNCNQYRFHIVLKTIPFPIYFNSTCFNK